MVMTTEKKEGVVLVAISLALGVIFLLNTSFFVGYEPARVYLFDGFEIYRQALTVVIVIIYLFYGYFPIVKVAIGIIRASGILIYTCTELHRCSCDY